MKDGRRSRSGPVRNRATSWGRDDAGLHQLHQHTRERRLEVRESVVALQLFAHGWFRQHNHVVDARAPSAHIRCRAAPPSTIVRTCDRMPSHLTPNHTPSSPPALLCCSRSQHASTIITIGSSLPSSPDATWDRSECSEYWAQARQAGCV